MGSTPSKTVGKMYIDESEFSLKIKEVKHHNNMLILYFKPKRGINIFDCKERYLAGEILASKINNKQKVIDKNIEFDIKFTEDVAKLITTDKGKQYEYGVNSGMIFENNSWINVDKKNKIRRIICIVKNKI